MSESSGRYATILVVTLIAVAAAGFLFAIGEIVRLLIVAALLAYILDPIANELESRGMNRVGATGVVFLGIGLAIYLIGFFLLPAFIHEIQNLQESGSPNQTSLIISEAQRFLNQKLAFFGLQKIDLTAKIQELKRGVGDQIIGYLVTNAVPFVAHAVAVPFIIFFLLKDGREMKRALLSVIPNRYFEFALNLLYKMDLQLGFYLRGQFLDALIFGCLSTVAMWILNVKFFVGIGIFAGLANLIPYVGPIAGGVLASMMTVMTTGDTSRLLYVIGAFAIVKLIDDAIIQPVVIAKSVDMHPLMVLLVVIIGGQFFGLMGMLLSVPFAGFVRVVFKESRLILRRYKFG